jgi:hypothetical protein
MRRWWRRHNRSDKAVLIAAFIGALVALIAAFIGALVVLLVGVIESVPDYLTIMGEGKQAFAPSPDLELSEFSVARRGEIDADYYDGETKTGHGRPDVTQLDVTVENTGKRPSLITKAELRVRRALHPLGSEGM